MIKLPQDYMFSILDINKILMLRDLNILVKIINIYDDNTIMNVSELGSINKTYDIYLGKVWYISPKIYLLEENIDYFLI